MRNASTFSALVVLALGTNALAAPIQIWRTFKADPATVLSGQGTDDPVIGSLVTTSAGSRLLGYAGSSVTLANVDDAVTLSFTVTFDDNTGTADSADNFRFALFNRNGEATPATENSNSATSNDVDSFTGYWFGIDSGSGAQGSMRERSISNTDVFANGATTLLGTASGGNVDFADDITYTGSMTIKRLAGNQLSLTGSFSGNATSNTFSFTETSPITYTYDTVGFLNGGGLSADVASFENVSMTFVPEPATLGVLGFGAMGLLARRRRD